MQRRWLLKSTGLALIGLQTATLTGCNRSTETAQSAQQPQSDQVVDLSPRGQLDEIASNLEGVEFVGPVCVDETMANDPLAELLERLPASSSMAITERFSNSMALDYANNEVFDIGGWQLSRSECLLLAGAALAQGLREPTQSREQNLVFEDFVNVERWGPDETIEGEIFNEVGDGRGAFWVRVAEPVPASTRMVLGETTLATHFEPGVMTASLEPTHTQSIISSPGMHQLVMVDIATNRAQVLGHLTVRRKPPAAILADGRTSSVFCEVERWGPDHAPLGQAFNEQPDGSAAFWVRIGCAPETAVLELDSRPLPTTVRSGLVTARVPFYADLSTDDHSLAIYDQESGERLQIGLFRVL